MNLHLTSIICSLFSLTKPIITQWLTDFYMATSQIVEFGDILTYFKNCHRELTVKYGFNPFGDFTKYMDNCDTYMLNPT